MKTYSLRAFPGGGWLVFANGSATAILLIESKTDLAAFQGHLKPTYSERTPPQNGSKVLWADASATKRSYLDKLEAEPRGFGASLAGHAAKATGAKKTVRTEYEGQIAPPAKRTRSRRETPT